MNGLLKFLEFIVDNWSLLVAAVIAVSAGVIQLRKYFEKTDEEKIEIAKKLIKETIMDYISRSEIDWEDVMKAGSIKRAQVIKEIFEDYPILYKVADQDNVIKFIDDAINEGLKELRKIITLNKEQKE